MDGDDLTDRPRGLLTDEDRQFLLGEMDFSEYKNPEQTRRTRRHRIRDRVRHGIIDFNLIRELPNEDLTQLFDISDFDSLDDLEKEDALMLQGFQQILYVFFMIVGDNPWIGRSIVASAFQDVANDLDPERYHEVVDFGLEVDATPYAELLKDFHNREPLTDDQLAELYVQGFITEDQIDRYAADVEQ